MNGWLIALLIAAPILSLAVGIVIGRTAWHHHKWGRWGFIKDRHYIDRDGDITRRVKLYARVCNDCGFPETREIEN